VGGVVSMEVKGNKIELRADLRKVIGYGIP
jgi:hypothetical protein